MIGIILFVIWLLASAHCDMLIEKKLGPIDYNEGTLNWLPEWLTRIFLASVLWPYIEYSFYWLSNKIQK